MNNQLYAVLTGDLVDSSKMSSRQSSDAMQHLREAAARFQSLHPGSIAREIDTFRHDSWQLLMPQPARCLRAAVHLRAALKRHSNANTKFDSRISIGIGKVELISHARISDSRGEAFSLSGRNLETMTNRRLTLHATDKLFPALDLFQRLAIPLLDCLVTDWTPAEAHAVLGALEGLTQIQIARQLPPNPHTKKPVTRQAIADALLRAHWNVAEYTWLELEKKSKLYGLPLVKASL